MFRFNILRLLTRTLEAIGDILVARIYVRIRYDFRNNFSASNHSLIVLGNGPSLKEYLNSHVDEMISKDIICCNEFAHSEYYAVLKPKYYVLVDPAYWRNSPDKSINETIAYTVHQISARTSWPMTIFIKSAGRRHNHFKQIPEINQNVRIVYIYTNTIDGPSFLKHYFYKKNLAMPSLYNVLGYSIFLGINMGYKKIMLLGADHSWHKGLVIKEDNILYLRDAHFFDKNEAAEKPFFVDSFKSRTFKLHEILSALSRTFEGYHSLRDYARHMKVHVLNLTIDSSIDAFERK